MGEKEKSERVRWGGGEEVDGAIIPHVRMYPLAYTHPLGGYTPIYNAPMLGYTGKLFNGK
jgi:hypothetical protein